MDREPNESADILQDAFARLKQLNTLIGERDGQEAYISDAAVKTLADEIVQKAGCLVEQVLTEPKFGIDKHFHNNSRFTYDEFYTIGMVGNIGGVSDDANRYKAGRRRFGGLLAAVLTADPEKSIGEFEVFARKKIKGAILDSMRLELGRAKRGNGIGGQAVTARKAVRIQQMAPFSALINPAGEPMEFSDNEGINVSGVGITPELASHGLLRAVDTMPEPYRKTLTTFFTSLPTEAIHKDMVAVVNKKRATIPLLPEALTELKFAYCQLPDEDISPELAQARHAIGQATNLKELAERVYAFRDRANIRQSELANKFGISVSRESVREEAHYISQEILNYLGIREKHLPEFARRMPKFWSAETLAARKAELIHAPNTQDFCQRVSDIFTATAELHPERMALYFKRDNLTRSKGHTEFLKYPANWRTGDQSKKKRLVMLLDISGITLEMVPPSARPIMPELPNKNSMPDTAVQGRWVEKAIPHSSLVYKPHAR